MIKAILDFANPNSPAITAISTLALVVVTGWYVHLTREQLRQLVDQKHEARRYDARVLAAICRRLCHCLERLPERINDGSEDGVLYPVIWDGGDLHELELRAATVGAIESEDAMHVVNSLRWIGDVIQECKRHQESPSNPLPSSHRKSEWPRKLQDATARLAHLVECAERATNPKPAVCAATVLATSGSGEARCSKGGDMDETGKRRFDAIATLWKNNWENFNERRKYEWKLAFGIWTAPAIFISRFVFEEPPRPEIGIKVGACILALVAIVAHYLFLWGLLKKENRDIRIMVHYQGFLHTLSGLVLSPELEYKPKEIRWFTPFRDWSCRTQVAITAVLYATVILLVFR